MTSHMEVMQLCRLCLEKEQVNVQIFEDSDIERQVHHKISTCLPVKVEKEDILPKKICDGCMYKLDILYEFWTTCANAETQLNEWLQESEFAVTEEEAEIDTKHEALCHGEEETLEEVAEIAQDALEEEVVSEPPPKRIKKIAENNEIGIELMTVAKTEVESDEEQAEETVYEEQPIDVPGPSGISQTDTKLNMAPSYECEVCSQLFSNRKAFLKHHMSLFGSTFICCRCQESFKNSTELYQHYEEHKLEKEMLYDSGNMNEEVVEEETVELHYTGHDDEIAGISETEVMNNPELLYILDDNQCVNEVVIEDADQKAKKMAEKFTVVQVDHGGYVIPSVFKGQLESKRRLKKKDPELLDTENDEVTKATDVLLKLEPGSSRINPPPKLKIQPPKRRHEVPDFSSTTYQLLKPTEEVDMPHYKCLRCEQLFISKFVFFRHIEKGKCYVNSCDACPATFDKNTDFYYHYVQEHTERAICNFCFRTFMYEKNVKEHMLRHLDMFRHRCEECNKGFYTVREYRNHYKNRHMGIRHKCDQCGRSFADEYYFKRHLATHGIKQSSISLMTEPVVDM